jgi:hypothetical protein
MDNLINALQDTRKMLALLAEPTNEHIDRVQSIADRIETYLLNLADHLKVEIPDDPYRDEDGEPINID